MKKTKGQVKFTIQVVGQKSPFFNIPAMIVYLRSMAYIYRFTAANICVQQSFSTTITTNGGAAQVRGNFASQRVIL